jgi:hypothetical protein
MPMLLVASHYSTGGPWTTRDTIIFVGLAAVLVVGYLVGALIRIRHARAALTASLHQAGCEIVRLQYRFFSWGPYYRWTTNQSGQSVYRFVVRTPDGGQRQGWARWGRPWFWMADKLELRWDDRRSESTARSEPVTRSIGGEP